MYKKLLLVILLFFVFLNTAFAVKIKASGKYVIENDNLRAADKLAKEDALLNALKTYFESTGGTSDIPEITTEFFKFIKSYKILERYVSDYTVYYTVEADVDEIAKSDLNHYLNSVSHSVVYYVKVNKDDDFSEISLKTVNRFINKTFEKYSFMTKYQESFDLALSEKPDFEEIIKQFSINRARFLFYIEISSSCENADSEVDCEVTTISRIYTKQKGFPVIKSPTYATGKNKKEALLKGFDNNFENVLKYVRENFIPLPKINFEVKEIQVTVINYKRFTDIKKILNALKDKKIINSYSIKSYTSNNVVFVVKTTFDQTNLISKIKSLNKENKFSVQNQDSSILINFLPESQILN
jgi:hypothetical protein